MLEKPDISETLLVSRLQDEYGLRVAHISFMPLGVDVNAAVYQLVVMDGSRYFLKLRKGEFDEVAVRLPHWLKNLGIPAIIAPLETENDQLWGEAGEYKLILYPFISGKDGYERRLSEGQWVAFGGALREIHAAHLPPALHPRVRSETFTAKWRDKASELLRLAVHGYFDDPVAAKFAAFMRAKQELIRHMVARANQLALEVQNQSPEFVLCHADIHPGNLLIPETQAGDFYIVDWDDPCLAPKEHDLMHIGGSSTWSGEPEQALFYQGYGPAKIDPAALAYYRYERIIQDIAEFGKSVLLTRAGGEDREQAYHYFCSIFLPKHEAEIAVRTDA